VADFEAQGMWLRAKPVNHPLSSPTQCGLDQYDKGIETIAHENALLRAKVTGLELTNTIFPGRRQRKRKQIAPNAILTFEEGSLISDGALTTRVVERDSDGRAMKATKQTRHCKTCGLPGHYATTCSAQKTNQIFHGLRPESQARAWAREGRPLSPFSRHVH